MKAVLGVAAIAAILVLSFTTISMGQGSRQPMYTGPIAVDYSCSWDNSACGEAFNGCTSLEFTPAESGTVYLHVWIECNPDHRDCGNCFACGQVWGPDGLAVSDLVHTFCPDCDQDYPATQPFTLQGGTTYRLVVCKRPCDEHCDGCSSDCVAKAQVHR